MILIFLFPFSQLHLDATLKAPPHRAHYALFFLPLFLDVLHSTVHHVFAQLHNYARWFANGEFGDASKRRMALLMDALFDPQFRVSALQKPMAVWVAGNTRERFQKIRCRNFHYLPFWFGPEQISIFSDLSITLFHACLI
jgi:hypothetical protein